MFPVKYCVHSGLYAWHLKYLLARLSLLVDLFQNASVKTPYHRVSHSLGGAEENAVSINKSIVCAVSASDVQLDPYTKTWGHVEHQLTDFLCVHGLK